MHHTGSDRTDGRGRGDRQAQGPRQALWPACACLCCRGAGGLCRLVSAVDTVDAVRPRCHLGVNLQLKLKAFPAASPPAWDREPRPTVCLSQPSGGGEEEVEGGALQPAKIQGGAGQGGQGKGGRAGCGACREEAAARRALWHPVRGVRRSRLILKRQRCVYKLYSSGSKGTSTSALGEAP